MNRKISFFTISLVLGSALFLLFLYYFGKDALNLIKLNINFYYLSIFILISLATFIPATMRFKVILDIYKKISIFTLARQTISAFAVSYITPVTRLGGEPVRIYMLKKECKIDYKIGTTAVVLDKFVEILGSTIYGIIGLILLISLFGVPTYFKIIFGSLVFFTLFILYLIYHKSVKGEGSFTSLFVFLRLNKIKKFKKFFISLKGIDSNMKDFFKNHKKSFFLSCFYYVISGILFIFQFKFLLLSIGFDASLLQLILIINIWGLLNFVPIPGSLGFLEAGQSSLFYLLNGETATGFAMTLILRVGYLLIVCLGFLFISHFSIKRIRERKEKIQS